MDGTIKYHIIKHENLAGNLDENIDFADAVHHGQIFTDNSVDTKPPALNGIVNKRDLNNESHVDMSKETPNKNESSTFELSIIKQEQNCIEENDELIATDSVSSSVCLYILKN